MTPLEKIKNVLIDTSATARNGTEELFVQAAINEIDALITNKA